MQASFSEYVGIPFKSLGRDRSGCDCWGLARLVLRERFGIDVPSYAEKYATAYDREQCNALAREKHLLGWLPAVPPRDGDVIELRVKNFSHVGIVIEARAKKFLHIQEVIKTRCGVHYVDLDASLSCVEQWNWPKWGHRVMGFWRYAG